MLMQELTNRSDDILGFKTFPTPGTIIVSVLMIWDKKTLYGMDSFADSTAFLNGTASNNNIHNTSHHLWIDPHTPTEWLVGWLVASLLAVRYVQDDYTCTVVKLGADHFGPC